MIEIAKEEALQYVLEEVEGETVPFITTAFWIEDSGAYSIDSFEEMEEHGGFYWKSHYLIRNQRWKDWKKSMS